MSLEQKVLVLERTVLQLSGRVQTLEQKLAELTNEDEHREHRFWVERNPPEDGELEDEYYARYRKESVDPLGQTTFNSLPDDHEIVIVYGRGYCWFRRQSIKK